MNANVERRARAATLASEPYSFVLHYDAGSDAWTVTVLELPGVISEGDSPDEAIAEGRDALEEMIDYYLEQGRAVPEPFQTREFSGRTELRLNPELHRRVVMLAAEQGVSLNRWLSAAVAGYAGSAGASAPSAPPAAARRPEPPSMLRVAEEPPPYEDGHEPDATTNR